jgi:hypothetical protein
MCHVNIPFACFSCILEQQPNQTSWILVFHFLHCAETIQQIQPRPHIHVIERPEWMYCFLYSFEIPFVIIISWFVSDLQETETKLWKATVVLQQGNVDHMLVILDLHLF